MRTSDLLLELFAVLASQVRLKHQTYLSFMRVIEDFQGHCDFVPTVNVQWCASYSFFCSYTEDNQWYRAKVLAYSPEDRVFVGYIDFGNSEEVSLNQLRPISMALLSLAAQAIPCALAGKGRTCTVHVVLILNQCFYTH